MLYVINGVQLVFEGSTDERVANDYVDLDEPMSTEDATSPSNLNEPMATHDVTSPSLGNLASRNSAHIVSNISFETQFKIQFIFGCSYK